MAARKKPFHKILIANRGEIACRIIRTAKKMGIKTVAVYSDADQGALHVLEADEAVHIGLSPASESYLCIDKIVQAMKQTKAQAVHPGYGFLSENAAFARTLKREGLTFIGPNVRAIKAMGDKIESKKRADQAGVKVVPGHAKALEDFAEAKNVALSIGYPVMLKASAGGGGKGMRVCDNEQDLKDSLASVVREAKSSFGDDRVFIEKFIVNPRHIEIQVLADAHGNIVHLGERECSLQRRHQKVIEEAPSAFLDDETRQAMGAQAIKLAKAVNYVSAGTVEFIVDEDRNFFFLEMNTRLQVEHPVTEYVTGLDLVEHMIRIAAGEKLSLTQADVTLTGWAMESRIYAEDPVRGFLPSTGRLVRYVEPVGGHIRVDSGVCEGDDISMFYDPMIAKLVTCGVDRNQAISSMSWALDAFYIRGVEHNISFLSALMNHPRFIEGRLTTGFIKEEYPDGFDAKNIVHNDPNMLVGIIACVHQAYQVRAAKISGQTNEREQCVMGNWSVVWGKKTTAVHVECVPFGFDIMLMEPGEVKDKLAVRTDWNLGEDMLVGVVNGQKVCVQIERLAVGYRVLHSGTQADIRVMKANAAKFMALMPSPQISDTSKFLRSPMPGLLLSLSAKVGQVVKSGEPLAIIEAMKMENVLRAEQDGVINDVKASVGESLAVDQIIVTFE